MQASTESVSLDWRRLCILARRTLLQEPVIMLRIHGLKNFLQVFHFNILTSLLSDYTLSRC